MEILQQLNLFNFDKEKYVITKPLRLIELFSGIGSQHKALSVLAMICPSFKFESWKTCEWAVPSIKGYNAIHIKDFTDYSKDLTKQELIDYLDGNISTDYNQPCDVKKKNETWLRDVYNNCIATRNLMNILIKVDDEWEEWLIKEKHIELCPIYLPPYNFKRTGCKFCPFSLDLEKQLEVAYRLLPNEAKQGEMIWKPVFETYRKLGYRLKKAMQIKLID